MHTGSKWGMYHHAITLASRVQCDSHSVLSWEIGVTQVIRGLFTFLGIDQTSMTPGPCRSLLSHPNNSH